MTMGVPVIPTRRKSSPLLARPVWIDLPFTGTPPEIVGYAGFVYHNPVRKIFQGGAVLGQQGFSNSPLSATPNPNPPTIYRYTIKTVVPNVDEVPSKNNTGSSKSSSRGDRVPPIVVAEITPRTPKLRNSYSTNIVEDFVNGIKNFFKGQ